MNVARYTVLRTMLFLGCLLVFSLLRQLWDLPLVAVVLLAAVSSLALSLVLLRGPREQMAARLAERVASRLPAEGPAEGSDEAAEDSEDDARRADEARRDDARRDTPPLA